MFGSRFREKPLVRGTNSTLFSKCNCAPTDSNFWKVDFVYVGGGEGTFPGPTGVRTTYAEVNHFDYSWGGEELQRLVEVQKDLSC